MAPPIPRCGELGGIGRWGLIPERRVWPARIKVGDPTREHGARMVEPKEQRLVQELIPQPALEALADPVLHRLAGRDEVPWNLVLARPGEHRVRGELGAVVGDDELGLATPGDQVRELARDPLARDRGVGDRRQALLGDIVEDVQDPEAPAAGHLVVDEVDRPASVRACGPDERRSRADGPLATAPTLDHESLLAVEALGFLAVEDQPLPAQQDMQAPVAEATPFGGKLSDSAAQGRIVRSPAAIPDHASVHTRKGTRPPLAQLVASAQMSDGLSPGGGRHHFLASRSFSATLSSMASARSFLSLVFSSSSAFSRRASETSSPPNLLGWSAPPSSSK